MNTETLRTYCLSLPHATEDIKWGHDLCFLVAGKMFTVASLDSDNHCAAFKCTPEVFAELVELEGIVPAPYMARNHWVMLERFEALRDAEIKQHVKQSYEMVLAKLPKKVQEGLPAAAAKKNAAPAKKKAAKKRLR